MQQSHGASHVHNAYAQMEARMGRGIPLWMVWARMYLPFMYRPVAEHRPSIEHAAQSGFRAVQSGFRAA
jgi:hypothetical protein